MKNITCDPIHLENFLTGPYPTCGASAIFVGRVRNHQEGRQVLRLFYDCYEAMAEKEIRGILKKVKQITGADFLHVIHRIGWLEIGDIAVAIEAHSAHRDAAFKACREVIEQIKHKVPIWKKEIYADREESWVACGHAGAQS